MTPESHTPEQIMNELQGYWEIQNGDNAGDWEFTGSKLIEYASNGTFESDNIIVEYNPSHKAYIIGNTSSVKREVIIKTISADSLIINDRPLNFPYSTEILDLTHVFKRRK